MGLTFNNRKPVDTVTIDSYFIILSFFCLFFVSLFKDLVQKNYNLVYFHTFGRQQIYLHGKCRNCSVSNISMIWKVQINLKAFHEPIETQDTCRVECLFSYLSVFRSLSTHLCLGALSRIYTRLFSSFNSCNNETYDNYTCNRRLSCLSA